MLNQNIGNRNASLIKLFIVINYFTAFGGAWDIWWHRVYGRDTFWIPPHLFLYIGIFAAIAMAWIVWKQTQTHEWRILFFITLLAPLAGPFDEIWHRTFGKELLSSPIIIWSPPHVLLAGSILISALYAGRMLRKNATPNDHLFLALAIASAMRIFTFLASPLHPLGHHHMLGFYGAFIPEMIFLILLYVATRWIAIPYAATLLTFVYISLDAIGFDAKPLPDVPIGPHQYPYGWNHIMSLLVPATLTDMLHKKVSPVLLWGINALLISSIIYVGGMFFRDAGMEYTISDAVTAVSMTTIAGILFGYFFELQKTLPMNEIAKLPQQISYEIID